MHVHSYFTHSYGFLSCPSRPPLWKNALHVRSLELALKVLHGWVIGRQKCHVKFSRGTVFTRKHVEWQWQWRMKTCATHAARQNNLFAIFRVDALHGIAFRLWPVHSAIMFALAVTYPDPGRLGPQLWAPRWIMEPRRFGPQMKAMTLTSSWKNWNVINSQQHIPPSKADIHPNNTHTHTHSNMCNSIW